MVISAIITVVIHLPLPSFHYLLCKYDCNCSIVLSSLSYTFFLPSLSYTFFLPSSKKQYSSLHSVFSLSKLIGKYPFFNTSFRPSLILELALKSSLVRLLHLSNHSLIMLKPSS